MAKKKADRWVVVATSSRPWSVVFGRVEEESADRVVLLDARMAVYWSRETRSLFGCAVSGPQAGARVSPRAPRAVVCGAELVLDATAAACAAWEAEPWS